MDCVLREYEDHDFEGLSRLLHEAYGTTIDEVMLQKHYLGETKRIIIAANPVTEEPAGCAFTEEQTDYIRPDKVLYITYVAVDKRYRGQGIGKKIMKYVEDIGTELQCNAIELTSANHRTGAHAFYYALGFSIKQTTHFIMELKH